MQQLLDLIVVLAVALDVEHDYVYVYVVCCCVAGSGTEGHVLWRQAQRSTSTHFCGGVQYMLFAARREGVHVTKKGLSSRHFVSSAYGKRCWQEEPSTWEQWIHSSQGKQLSQWCLCSTFQGS
jgi:hypothetical protein